MINTFSLYADPSSCTDFKSTPFMPFLPSLPRRLRKHRRMQKKHTPSTTTEMPMKIATTPHGCTCNFSLAKFISRCTNDGRFVPATSPAADASTSMADAVVPSPPTAANQFERENKWIFIWNSLGWMRNVYLAYGVCAENERVAQSLSHHLPLNSWLRRPAVRLAVS